MSTMMGQMVGRAALTKAVGMGSREQVDILAFVTSLVTRRASTGEKVERRTVWPVLFWSLSSRRPEAFRVRSSVVNQGADRVKETVRVLRGARESRLSDRAVFGRP